MSARAQCRTNPGQWQTVGEYRATTTATATARNVRAAYVNPRIPQRSAYTPAGAFEARTARTEFGTRVEARYVSDRNAAWADAVAALTTTHNTSTGEPT